MSIYTIYYNGKTRNFPNTPDHLNSYKMHLRFCLTRGIPFHTWQTYKYY